MTPVKTPTKTPVKTPEVVTFAPSVAESYYGGGGGGWNSGYAPRTAVTATYVTTAKTLFSCNPPENVSVKIESAAFSLDTAERKKLISFDPQNEKLLEIGYNIKISGKASAQVKIDADVSTLNITNKSAATAIYYDPAAKEYKRLGGEFSANGKTFSFYTNHPGLHGIIISEDLMKIRLTINNKNISKNSKAVLNDVAPFISNDGRTMVPIRAVAETMGADVTWIDSLKTAIIKRGDARVSLTLGKTLPNAMGDMILLNSRIFVPIRYVAEQFDANVVWNDAARTVDIYY